MTGGILLMLGCIEPSPTDDTTKDSVDTGTVDTAHTADTAIETGDTDTGETGGTGETSETAETGDSGTAVELCNELDTADGEVPRCDRSRPWIHVAGGGGLTCGIHDDGCAECWGVGEAENSKYGGYVYRHEDIPPDEEFVRIGMHGYDSLGAAGFHVCGITTDGRVRCWSDDLPEAMEEVEGPFVDVAVYSLDAHAVREDGTIFALNGSYEPAGADFVAIRSGQTVDIALRSDGTAVSFDFRYGFEVEYEGPYTQVDVGDYPCGLKTDGTFECWGDDDIALKPIMADAPDGLVDFCQTLYAACGLDADGYVTCWGDTKWFPGGWPTDVQFSQLGCGVSHACGVTPDGEMHCWADSDPYCATVVPT